MKVKEILIMIYKDLLSIKEDLSDRDEFNRIEFLKEIDDISREMTITFFNEKNIISSIKDALDKTVVEKTAKNMTDSFCKSITKVHDYFYKNASKNMNNSKILENKALLVNWTENVPLAEEINYHDYANLECNIPPISILNDFLNEFRDNIGEVKKLANSYDDDARTLVFDYLTDLMEKTDAIINSDDVTYVNKIKQKLIESTKLNISNINHQTINELIQDIYVNRDGFSATDAMVINGEMVQRSFDRYIKLGNTIRTMTSTKNNIVGFKNKIVDMFKANSPKNIVKDISKRTEGADKDSEFVLLLYKYYKLKIEELKKLFSTIYWIYYTRCTLIYTSSIKDRMICLKVIEYNKTKNTSIVKESAIIHEFKRIEDEQLDDLLEYGYYKALSECKNELLDIYVESLITEADDNDNNPKESIAKKAGNAIQNFLNKIIGLIQGIWNKFMNATKKAKWEMIKKTYEKELQMNITLDITDVNKSDVNPDIAKVEEFVKIPNGQVDPKGIIDVNTDNVNDEETFNKIMKQYRYFNQIDVKKDSARKSMEEFVNKNCFKELKVGDQIVLDDIKTYMGFLDAFDSNITNIQNDIKDINARVKDFEHMNVSKYNDTQRTLNNVNANNQQQANQQPQQQQSQEAYYDIYQSYILELKTQDHDNPGGNKKQMEVVTQYFNIYNTVLSLKMQTMNKARIACERLCLEYARQARKSNG